MPIMTQYEASRAIEATLKRDHGSWPKGTKLQLEYVRSYLSRPRFLGGKLQHDFHANVCDPAGNVQDRFLATDAMLEKLVFRPTQAPTRH